MTPCKENPGFFDRTKPQPHPFGPIYPGSLANSRPDPFAGRALHTAGVDASLNGMQLHLARLRRQLEEREFAEWQRKQRHDEDAVKAQHHIDLGSPTITSPSSVPYSVVKATSYKVVPMTSKVFRNRRWNELKSELNQHFVAGNNYLDAALSILLIELSLYRAKSFSAPFSTKGRQQLLSGTPEEMTSVLFMDFATGTGQSVRVFHEKDKLTKDFVYGGTGYVYRSVINGFYREVAPNKITMLDFSSIGASDPIAFGLSFSPDQGISATESRNRHFDSNEIQFFIESANVRVWSSDKSGRAQVEIMNRTSRNSLIAHVGDNYSTGPLRTIEQRIYFTLKVDPRRFSKNSSK